MYIAFWGAGQIGREILEYWNYFGLKPDCFCDCNDSIWGNEINGIPIYNPLSLKEQDDVIIFITCSAASQVIDMISQLMLKKVEVVELRTQYGIIPLKMLERLYKYRDIKAEYSNICCNNVFLMDFQYGTSLGGVQTWCYRQAEIISSMGYKGYYFMPDDLEAEFPNDCFEVEKVESNSITKFDNYIEAFFLRIISISPKYVIINFPREILYAAVLVKKFVMPEMKIIAVIHNDEDIYYDTYKLFEEYIDKFLVISKKVGEKICSNNIPMGKISRMQWKIEMPSSIRKNERLEKIRIGYAGRLSFQQKRMDLLMDIVKKLEDNSVEYLLDIAGCGEAEAFMKEEIKNIGASKHVKICGYIEHEEIFDFWKSKDVYISCSDYEGHSISQCEAMACGAVPVTTDVSGVEDDIVNGYNGFISQPGDTQGIIDNIVYLSKNPDVLHSMSVRAREKIVKNNFSVDECQFWKDIIYSITT